MSRTAQAKTAGVIGWPVAHSLSPPLHEFWLRQHGIEGAYVALPVRPSDFSVAIRGLMAAGFAGVNVTVPHKQAAFALAHQWDEAARRAGAANLLLFHGDHIEARNTDAEGLAASLVKAIGPLDGKTILILGAGGAARAAILSCERAARIDVLNRSERNARVLVDSVSSEVSAKVAGSGLDRWDDSAPLADLVINATNAGMSGSASPDVDLEVLPPGAAVCDLVYNPLETPLLARARARGLTTIDGLGMLMFQAVPAFEAFYGIRPQVTPALRAELGKALNP
jgi:shikimate dehydrogenase